MPGFNAQQINPKVLTSNAVVIMVGDQEVAFGQTSSLSVGYGTEGFYGVGTAKPQEIQQLRASFSVTLAQFALSNEGLAFFNYPSTLGTILSNNQFNITVMGSNHIPVWTFAGCTAGDYSFNSPANSPITEDITFLAMDCLNPLGISILQGNFALNVSYGIAALVTNTVI